MNLKPAFPLSVTPDLWLAFANSFTPAFADSYLYGADVRGGALYPRTLTAYHVLKERANGLMKSLDLKLEKPPAFQDSGRLSAAEELSFRAAA